MSFHDLLIHTVDIETATDDYSGGDGASSKTYAAASIDYKDIACRRIDIRGTFEEHYGGRNEKSTHKFLFKNDQEIAIGNRINEDGTYYIVESLGEGSSKILHHKTVYGRLIQ